MCPCVRTVHTCVCVPPDPLRPLWPALGIVCSLIITALFILGGTLVDKIRGKHSTTDDEGECVCVCGGGCVSVVWGVCECSVCVGGV